VTLLTAITYVFGIATCSIAVGGGLVCLGFGLHEQSEDMQFAGFMITLVGVVCLIGVSADFLSALDDAIRIGIAQ
jgi:hypothetical protein